jgi:signal transduction histidine kinase
MVQPRASLEIGIGPAIARQIVERHGGTVRANSQGKGKAQLSCAIASDETDSIDRI